MKPTVVIESLRLTYDMLYMNDKFAEMVKGAYGDMSEVEKEHITRFLFDGFSFHKVLQWQPHKDWYVPEVKQFLELYTQHFTGKDISGYMVVQDFLKQLAKYTAEMLTEDAKKEDWPFWFWTMYLRPAYQAKHSPELATPQ